MEATSLEVAQAPRQDARARIKGLTQQLAAERTESLKLHTKIVELLNQVDRLLCENDDLKSAKEPLARKVTFHQLLLEADSRYRYNPSLIERATVWFPERVLLALTEGNASRAAQIYKDTEALPQTETENALRLEGLILDGPVTGREGIIACFDKDLRPSVLKIVSDPREHFILKELERIKICDKSRHIVEFWLPQANNRFVVMPMFALTVANLRQIPMNRVEHYWDNMKDALMAFHSAGFAYMDIKPSNICLDAKGDFVLIDLGSVQKFGCRTTSTLNYHPRGIHYRGRAHPVIDWYMVAAVITERALGMKWPHLEDYRPTLEQTCAVISEKIGGKVWKELEEKMHEAAALQVLDLDDEPSIASSSSSPCEYVQSERS